jgi:hypothetical protein
MAINDMYGNMKVSLTSNKSGSLEREGGVLQTLKGESYIACKGGEDKAPVLR